MEGRDQGREFGCLLGLGQRCLERRIMSGPGLGEEFAAGRSQLGIDAAAVVFAQDAGQQPAVFQSVDEPR